MVSNFGTNELTKQFIEGSKCAAGNKITACNEDYVVITNHEKMRIAQIWRTSANRYEIIRACATACARTHRGSFYEAADIVNEFLSG